MPSVEKGNWTVEFTEPTFADVERLNAAMMAVEWEYRSTEMYRRRVDFLEANPDEKMVPPETFAGVPREDLEKLTARRYAGFDVVLGLITSATRSGEPLTISLSPRYQVPLAAVRDAVLALVDDDGDA